jgi:hypothetical protein
MTSRPTFLVGLLAALSLSAQLAFALPSVDEVRAAANQGDYPRAEQMMREVVEAKPGSAKAHYVLAEILARQRKFTDAAEQARLVRLNDPDLKTVDRAKFTEFERLLDRAQGASTAAAPAAVPMPARTPTPAPASHNSDGGVPLWMLLGGSVLFIGLAARWMRRRAAAPTGMPMPGYGGAGTMPMGGYGPGAAPSQGPGLMGVGLAAAGGVAAGMLAERMLHGGNDHTTSRSDGYAPGGAFEGGSQDLGAASDLASRDIDFGSGNSWDAGGGGGDFGGSDGGGGGDW